MLKILGDFFVLISSLHSSSSSLSVYKRRIVIVARGAIYIYTHAIWERPWARERESGLFLNTQISLFVFGRRKLIGIHQPPGWSGNLIVVYFSFRVFDWRTARWFSRGAVCLLLWVSFFFFCNNSSKKCARVLFGGKKKRIETRRTRWAFRRFIDGYRSSTRKSSRMSSRTSRWI